MSWNLDLVSFLGRRFCNMCLWQVWFLYADKGDCRCPRFQREPAYFKAISGFSPSHNVLTFQCR
jgi:hypothetical protein